MSNQVLLRAAKAIGLMVISVTAVVTNLSLENNYASGQSNGGGSCGGSCYIISNQVWIDDGDGIQEIANEIYPEQILPGVMVELYNATPNGDPLGLPIGSQLTNSMGRYSFDVQAGVYVLRFSYNNAIGLYTLAPANRVHDDMDSDADPATGFTGPIIIEIEKPVNDIWDAGFINDDCRPTVLGDKVWQDRNGDSEYQDGVDSGIGGVAIQLWQMIYEGVPTFRLKKTTTTTANGDYSFSCLDNGQYLIAIDGIENHQVVDQISYNPDNNIQNDNNCYNNPQFIPPDGFPESPSGVTQLITLSENGEPEGSTNNTLDCGFECNGDHVDTVLVLDNSGSMGDEIGLAVRALQLFVGTMNPEKQRVAIVLVNSTAITLPPGVLTSDKTALLQTLQSSEIRAGGGTAIDAGINMAKNVLIQGGHGAGGGATAKPIMIVLSDGESDNSSAMAAANAAREAVENLEIIAIGLGPEAGQGLLLNLAGDEANYYYSPDATELRRIYFNLANALCDSASIRLKCSTGIAQEISLSTGWNQNTDTPRSIGSLEDEWTVDDEAPFVVSRYEDPPLLWPLLPRAQWISPRADKKSTLFKGSYDYKITFSIPQTPGAALLRLYAYADDIIVPIDGGIGISINGVETQPLHHGTWGASSAAQLLVGDHTLFQAGNNELVIRVHDGMRGLTGLIATGSLSYCLGGAAPTPTLPPVQTPTPQATETPSATPGPCALEDTEYGENILGGMPGKIYQCSRIMRPHCHMSYTYISPDLVEKMNWRKDIYREDKLNCSGCGSFNTVDYCNTNSLDNVAISATLRDIGYASSPRVGWQEYDVTGANVHIINHLQGYDDIFQWGDNGYPDDGLTTERYVYWTSIDGVVYTVDPYIAADVKMSPGWNHAWVSPIEAVTNDCAHPGTTCPGFMP